MHKTCVSVLSNPSSHQQLKMTETTPRKYKVTISGPEPSFLVLDEAGGMSQEEVRESAESTLNDYHQGESITGIEEVDWIDEKPFTGNTELDELKRKLGRYDLELHKLRLFKNRIRWALEQAVIR